MNPFNSQRVYLDSSALIYWIETPLICATFVSQLEQAVGDGDCTLVASTVALAEVLVKPFREEDLVLALAYLELLEESGLVECLPVDQSIARRAAGLRARSSFRTPDSIHIATGQLAGCTLFATADQAWSSAGVVVHDPLST